MRVQALTALIYLLAVATQWLALVMGLFVSILATLVVCIAVSQRNTPNSLFAVALVQVIALPSFFSFLFQSVTSKRCSLVSRITADEIAELQIASISVKRTRYISDLAPEDNVKATEYDGKAFAIREANIEVEGLSLRYSEDPSAPYALKNINFSVKAGTRVGICGVSTLQ